MRNLREQIYFDLNREVIIFVQVLIDNDLLEKYLHIIANHYAMNTLMSIQTNYIMCVQLMDNKAVLLSSSLPSVRISSYSMM